MNIKEAIQQILQNDEEIYSIVGEVTAVDESARTVDVQPNDESAELFGVLLQANQRVAAITGRSRTNQTGL